MSKTSLAILIAASTALSTAAYATSSGALTALDNGDYAAARQLLEPLAQTGDAQAAFHLARIYENGWGVTANLSTAAGWYRKAGEAGLVEAQLRYGLWLEDGIGVPRDRKEALDWFRRAADKGNAAAKTKLGKYALYGIARKPNFVEARKWLNEAAEAGDAEAQALIQELADQNYPIYLVAGTSRPKDPAAQRVLAEVNDLIAPMREAGPDRLHLKLSQSPTISSGQDGHIVTLPGVQLVGATARLRLGNIQIAFAPDGEDYAIQVRLPSRAQLVDADGLELATIGLDRHSVTGKWSTALHRISDYRAELGRLTLQPHGLAFAMSIDDVTAVGSSSLRPDGRYDLTERVELRQAHIESGKGTKHRAVGIGSVGFAVDYQGFDLTALAAVAESLGIDWRSGAPLASGPAASAAMPQTLPPLLDAMKLSVRVKDVVLDGPEGRRLATMAGGELSLTGADLDRALSSLIVTYDYDGLDVADGDLAAWPARGHVQAKVSRLPLPRLLSAGFSALIEQRGGDLTYVSMAPRDARPGVLMPMMAAIADARSELHINEVALHDESYHLTGTGLVQPAGEGMAGALDITVGGLDALLQAGREITGFDFTPWRQLALARQDEAGRPVDVFRVALFPSGQLTVNGADAPPPLAAP